MQIGEVMYLQIPTPLLSIATTERAIYKEVAPAEIEYVAFSDMYEGDTKIYQEGHDGLNEVTVDVHRVNGIEEGRTLVKRVRLEEPKTKVIAYGTKEKPKLATNARASVISTGGSFMHPLNGAGYVSSPYGPRWGTFHYGIDLAASAGTPIYAAASGKVTYSGYNSGGYGNLVIIEHSDGSETYYAHCQSLYAQVGQSVMKGQNIATVGSTGNSTGNHIHFEIRNGGSPVNPYGYIY
jgi:murein DD-endopeptidase MepM/ murein hydrolase activator NlpD